MAEKKVSQYNRVMSAYLFRLKKTTAEITNICYQLPTNPEFYVFVTKVVTSCMRYVA